MNIETLSYLLLTLVMLIVVLSILFVVPALIGGFVIRLGDKVMSSGFIVGMVKYVSYLLVGYISILAVSYIAMMIYSEGNIPSDEDIRTALEGLEGWGFVTSSIVKIVLMVIVLIRFMSDVFTVPGRFVTAGIVLCVWIGIIVPFVAFVDNTVTSRQVKLHWGG